MPTSANPPPDCNPEELRRFARAFREQADALQQVSLECRYKDLGFHTPRGRESELKKYLSDWRRRVRYEVSTAWAVTLTLERAADTIEAKRGKS